MCLRECTLTLKALSGVMANFLSRSPSQTGVHIDLEFFPSARRAVTGVSDAFFPRKSLVW